MIIEDFIPSVLIDLTTVLLYCSFGFLLFATLLYIKDKEKIINKIGESSYYHNRKLSINWLCGGAVLTTLWIILVVIL